MHQNLGIAEVYRRLAESGRLAIKGDASENLREELHKLVVAKVMQREPRIQASRELRRFKQLMETGEISTSKAPEAAPRADRHF